MILGFDARQPLLASGGYAWTTANRSRFLIRPDVRGPASVDPSIWPEIPANKSETYPLPLWRSLRELLRACSKIDLQNAESVLAIEIAIVVDEQSKRYWEDVFYGYLRTHDDVDIDFATDEIGYDVADRFLVSGWSNCMPSTEELGDIRTKWSAKINSVALFGDQDDATAFCSVCDRLVPEHAPFSAYRIREVKIVLERESLPSEKRSGTSQVSPALEVKDQV
jgi:hypothetical protein